MTYVIPNEITEYEINTSISDYDAYSATKTYNIGDTCTIGKKNYKCTKDNTIGKNPTENSDLWVSETINAYALLNYLTSKKTEVQDEIKLSFRTNNIDFIALFGVEAESVAIKVTDIGTNTVIYNVDEDMSYDDLQNFGDYLFAPHELKTRLSSKFNENELLDIFANFSKEEIKDRLTANPPIYFDVKVEISIKNQGSLAKCAYLCCGRGKDLGISLEDGATTGIKSYTSKERDSWGNINIKQGSTYDTMEIPVLIYKEQFDVTKERLRKIDATPCVFIADESGGFESLTIFGIYKELEMPVRKYSTSYTLKMEAIIS